MPMHPAAKDELLSRLKRLSGEERESLFREASELAVRADGQERAATALANLVGHHQPKKGPEND